MLAAPVLTDIIVVVGQGTQMFGDILARIHFVALLAALIWWVATLIRKSDQRRRASIMLLVMLVLLFVLSQSQYVFLTEPLVDSARDGNLANVNRRLDLGAGIDSPGDDGSGTALIAAAAEDHPDVVALLIRRGADVNKSEEYAFHHFRRESPLEAAAGHPEIIAMLKKAGARE